MHCVEKTYEKTCDIKRNLPEWARVVRTINDTNIYNMNIFENIMSWNQMHLDIPAFDYYGHEITYGELPERVNEYVCGLRTLGIKEDDIVTLCLPVSIENMLMLFALNCMGIISNNVNFLFLRNDFLRYTKMKKSKTLVVLDAYLPFMVDYLEEAKIENVIITNLYDYLPEKNKHVFDDLSSLPKKQREIFEDKEKQEACLKKIQNMQSVRFIPLAEVIKAGQANLTPLTREPVDMNRDICYSYTSGTTGIPKCIVYKELSANAFIEMHAGLDTKDFVGERVFQIIPLTHATGERVSGYLPLAKGKTLVPQPIYNKETFGEALMMTKCNWVVAAPSFYLAAVAKGFISKDALVNLKRPSSGGEPVTKASVIQIDNWLKQNGCNVRFAIGGGAAEDGSGTLFTYFMDEEHKTNETGKPLKPYIRTKIVDEQGNVVAKGERGYLHISSPAAADRYLNDEDATKNRWYTDEAGIRWGITGDIAVQNEDDSFNILGRASDSYVDEKNERKFLFDIEYELDAGDPVVEWEISAHETEGGYAVVGQVILKENYKNRIAEMTEYLCEKYKLDAVKFYDSFENSDVTGKRDYERLKQDIFEYYAPCDENHLFKITYMKGQKPLKKMIEKAEYR